MSEAVKKIGSKIVDYAVAKESEEVSVLDQGGAGPDQDQYEALHEGIGRDPVLCGKTYKIKPPGYHALYITINDVILNEGTEREARRPFEIFINSKNMDNFQWIVAMTRVISAVFRKGGNVEFLVEELKSVFDPRGGWFEKGEFINSVPCAIGIVIEKHLKGLGLINDEQDPHVARYLEEKRAEAMRRESGAAAEKDGVATSKEDSDGFPSEAVQCNSCNNRAVVQLDGCATCLVCADSRCN